uniref:SPX domain-containing protein n=1 Tax=Leersia perrieri TaxID=77586 RepID=A0A0D9VDH1_9ORYZ
MKFGKSLSSQILEMQQEWRDNFLSYKYLKKRLNLICLAAGAGAGERLSKRRRVGGGTAVTAAAVEVAGIGMTAEQAGFVALLDAELDKFNFFFLEKEEEYVIKQKELRERMPSADASAEEVMRVRKEIVDLHGEMVLLENYSALNYTGLVKILKKYEKRTGSVIRLPFIQKVLQQPFFTTDLLYKLVKECEEMLDQLMPETEPSSVLSEDSESDEKNWKPSSSSANGRAVLEQEEVENEKSVHMKSTVAALRALREIRSGSSTVSVFSLPPLQGNNGQEQERSKQE